MSVSVDYAGSSAPVPGHHIEIREMYNMANRDGGSWGISGYRVPKEYLDSKLIKEAREGSKKVPPKPTKKGDFISAIQKHAATLPSPCQYNVTKPWADENNKSKAPKNVPHRTTYIEEIGLEAKRRPIPGVGAYNLNKDEKDKKQPSSTKNKGSERDNFLFDYEYLSNANPGPGNYNPRDIQPKIKETKLKPEDWIKKHAEENKSPKKVASADVGAYSPQPAHYMTFDRILEKHIANKGNSKSKTWGTEVRFSPEKKTKNPLVIPGPGQYDVTSTWCPESGKAKDAAAGKSGSNLFSKVTTGIQKSIYYS